MSQNPIHRQAIADWQRLPAGSASWSEVTGVAVDASDRVYVFARDPHRVLVFERDGTLLRTWGEGQFARPHGITIGPDGAIWCTDDLDHTVRKYSPEGKLLLKLGHSGQPSNTGATSVDFRTIRAAGDPFHFPTNVAFAPSGEVYITDGYGNARVHKFTPEGRLLFSWGEAGDGPGQFHIPHGIAVDKAGRVFVADRENSRIQIFSPDGKFLDQWTNIARPCQVTFDAAGNVLVAELGYRAGMWPGTSPPTANATGGRVSIFSPQGKLLSRWGGGENPTASGDFFAPHDICVDSHGDIYVAEVVWSAGGKRGLVPPTCHALQKFVHVVKPGASGDGRNVAVGKRPSPLAPGFTNNRSMRTEIITRIEGPPTGELAPGVELRVLATGSMGARGLTTCLATFKPGAQLGYHRHPCSEVIVVVEGEVLACVRSRRYLLRAHDALHVPAGFAHAVQNASQDKRAVLHSSFASDSPGREQVSDTFIVRDQSSSPRQGPEHLIRFDDAPVYELAAQAKFRDLFARRLGSRGICGGYGLFPPGTSLPCHYHEYDESITIVTGTAICQVAGREYELSGCGTGCIPKGRPHRFLNRSTALMAMIWVYGGDEPERTLLEPGYCDGSLRIA